MKTKEDGSYIYTTGTKEGPAAFNFPPEPLSPLLGMNLAYRPDKNAEKKGDIYFDVYRLIKTALKQPGKPLNTGKVVVGEVFDTGNYRLKVKEVRYWVAMSVRYEPGKSIVLASLWVGLFGVTLTTLARMFKKPASKRV
jgi:hypothetical protein